MNAPTIKYLKVVYDPYLRLDGLEMRYYDETGDEPCALFAVNETNAKQLYSERKRAYYQRFLDWQKQRFLENDSIQV